MWTLIAVVCFSNGQFNMCVEPDPLKFSTETSCHVNAGELRRRTDEELTSRGLVGVFAYECQGPAL